MQQHKIVEDYLDSVIPQKISSKVEKEIRTEIESHIYDRVDFYMEIGYDEESAIKKAVEQMGEGEDVKVQFSNLYKDSMLKAILLFLGICVWNVSAVTAGLGYMNFVDPVMYVLPNIVFLILILVGNVFLIVYTMKCIRQKLQKQLLGIVWAFVFVGLGSFVTSGIFFPVLNAGKLIIKYITNGAYPTEGAVSGSDLDITVINILLVILYTVFLFRAYDKMGFRNKPYRLSLGQITAVLSVGCLCFTAVYSLAYAKYEWSYTQVLSEMAEESDFPSNVNAEQRKIYDSIEIGDKISEAEKILIKNNFVKQNKNYADYIDNCYMPFWVDDYLSEKNPENMNENKYSIYCHTTEQEYKDLISCVVVSYDVNGRINYKLFVPDVKDIGHISYLNYNHGAEMTDLSENLQQGDDVKNVLDFIRTTGAHIIEDEIKKEENIINTYKIYFSCYYPLEPDIFDLIFNSFDEEEYEYEIEIISENGVIKKVKIKDGIQ